MAGLKLYKGTQAEYDAKKNKIADGGLVIVKDENTSQTGDLYINDGGTHVKIADNDAYHNLEYAPETGQLTGQKVKGVGSTLLTVDNALSGTSKNPVQNAPVANAISSHGASIQALNAWKASANQTISSHDTQIGALETWIEDADDLLELHSTKLAVLQSSDVGKSVRTIANEELAKQLLTQVGNDNFEDLKELAEWLDAHPEDAASMNAAINQLDLDKAEARVISQADYDNLSDAEKNNGTIYLIYDANDFVNATVDLLALQNRVAVLENNQGGSAQNVTYNNQNSGLNAANVQSAIDELNSKHNNLSNYVNTQLGNIETLLSQI